MAEVAAIILAAGGSSRFGRVKQLLEFGGITLIERTISAARGAGCNPTVVVTGSDAAKIAEAINFETVSIVENENWNRGIGTSIRNGLQQLIELAPQTKAVVLLVSDQPFVTDEVVTGLIKLWRTQSKPIVASSYSETLGVPALFDASCFDELLQLADDSGAKPIIFKNADRVSDFPFAEGATDIDTPTDYEKLGNSPPVRSPNPG